MYPQTRYVAITININTPCKLYSAGHPQAEHFTNHGSMARTQWAIDGPDGTVFELDGHKFGSSDDGAPMMCNLVCRNMGRHLHIDYCRTTAGNACNQAETNHIAERMVPNPDQAKDWITHNLYWRRLGGIPCFTRR